MITGLSERRAWAGDPGEQAMPRITQSLIRVERAVERGGGHWQAIPVYCIERAIEFTHWIASEAASRIACWTE